MNIKKKIQLNSPFTYLSFSLSCVCVVYAVCGCMYLYVCMWAPEEHIWSSALSLSTLSLNLELGLCPSKPR